MTKIFKSLDDVELIEALKSGAVGVMPTDTIYGLMCVANNKSAVERLYALKSRENKPGTVIAANTDQLIGLGIDEIQARAGQRYWPGPVSIVIPSDDAHVYLHQSKYSLATRLPDAPQLVRLMEATGALLTSSANLPGESPAETIEQAKKYFGDKVDFYVDGGDLHGQLPSTIIRFKGPSVEVLRQGAVRVD